ncbi:MAG: hypothetical protein LC792_24015, partial [Actinobacteria bacterium]|nr:hypothetical protein [Actinomycetota bacterium]
FDTDGRFRTDLSVDELDVPEGVRLVVGQRLRRLGEDGSKVLGSAAVIGRVFSFELLQVVEDMPEDPLLDIVERAERAGLIVPVEDGSDEDRFMFAHELIRQTVVAELSAPRRRRLHVRAADALERVYAGNLSAQAATIAHHLLEAGPAADAKRAFRYLTLAGEAALDSAAYEEALRYFELARSTIEQATPREVADLLFGLGRAQRSLGDWDQAMQNWRESLDGYASLGEGEEVGRLCWELAWQMIWVGRVAESVEMSQRGLHALGTGESPAGVGLLALAGMAFGMAGDHDAGAERIGAALELAEAVDDRLVQARVLKAAAVFRWAYYQLPQSVDTGRRASVLLKDAGALWDYAETMAFVQMCLHALGRWDEAAEIDAEVDPLAARLGMLPVTMICRRERASRERNLRPDLDRHEAFARADLDLTRRTGMAWIAHSYLFLALVDFWRGRWEQSLEHVRTAVSHEPPGIVALWSPSAELLLTAYAGDPNDALRMYRGLSPQLPGAGRTASLSGWFLVFSGVEALVVIGERSEAAALYPLVIEAIEMGNVVDGYGGEIQGRLLHMLAGMAAGAGGRWDEAETHFNKALDQAEILGLQMERPDLLRFYAGMLIDRGRPEDEPRVRQFLDEATETYQALSMPRHEEMSAQLLDALADR